MRGTMLPALAVATLLAFLGILVWEVPHLDLGIIVAIAVLLVVWDLLVNRRGGSR